MPKTIRDTIHGDVDLDDVAVSVIDTREFQRLRYIRQTGLLHFVFPGAIHTRFTHSIGAHWIARKVAHRLFGPLFEASVVQENDDLRKGLEYLRLAFTSAALLHDVGHVAFSHSSEHVSIDGKGLLGTVGELLDSWESNDPGFIASYVKSLPQDRTADSSASHEDLSILFTRKIFQRPGPMKACAAAGVDPVHLAADVGALIHGGLPTSTSFVEGSRALVVALVVDGPLVVGDRVGFLDPESVLDQLHGLISGTLDVDRLDYLIRDSAHAGVSYGKLDVDFLIRNLTFALVAGKPQILLRAKALFALDDMLWSRYQLFIQVLNHKSNVGLDAVLGKVIAEAVAKNVLTVPRTPNDFITFTDDHVMSRLSGAVVSGELADSQYGRILVDRIIPEHLKDIPQDIPSDILDSYAKTLAEKRGATESQVIKYTVSATLLKPESAMPWLLKGDASNRYMDRYDLGKSSLKGIQPKYTITHLFLVPDQQATPAVTAPDVSRQAARAKKTGRSGSPPIKKAQASGSPHSEKKSRERSRTVRSSRGRGRTQA